MSTTRITDNDYADVALYDKVNMIANEIDNEVSKKANSSNTVTTDTTQTINGLKTFTNDIKRIVDIDVTTAPTSIKYILPFTVDNADQSLRAYQQLKQETNGKITYTIGLRRNVNGENKFNVIDLETDASGNTAVKVLNPPTSSNGQNIATTAWVNTKLGNYLPLSGGKITGDIIRRIDTNVSQIPTTATYIAPWLVENDDQSLRAFQRVSYHTSGILQNSFGLRRRVNGTDIYNTIDVDIDINGNKAVYAVTPPTASNGTHIATTAWVHNAKSIIVGWCIPDYTAGISFTSTTNYTTPNSGYVVFDSHSPKKFYEVTVYVDDKEVFYAHTGDFAKYPIIFPVKAGQKVRISDESFRGTFYPMKGL